MELVQSKKLLSLQGILHGFFRPGQRERANKNLSFKNGDADAVFAARQRACSMLGMEAGNLTHVYQEHGVAIWTAETHHRGAGARDGENQMEVGDAMLTSEPLLPLAIMIADCLPLFFASKDGGLVGLAHAGWRGTLDNIASRMVQRFRDDFAVPSGDLLVWLGPAISICCFQVKDDVWLPFQERWNLVPGAFGTQSKTIGLKEINRYQLLQAGIGEEHLEISPDCTCCNPHYFSYRREGPGIGHNMAVIQRNP
jgi:YfiH family protein